MSNKKDILKERLEGNDLDFIARFACLMYGVNVAADAAEKQGIDINKSNEWIKPIAFQKYVQERFEDMKYNILRDQAGEGSDKYSW